jgi:succinate dehydrogenase/fumarate reductase flavoprotein subunit
MNKHNSDDLKMLSDNDVEYLFKSIKRDIFRLEKNIENHSSKGLEKSLNETQIEYCYIKREHDSRAVRYEKHQEYLKNLEKWPFQKENRV